MPTAKTLPSELPAATGCQRLLDGVTVADFWAWALSDLRMNTTRGYLAEFLVAQALRDPERRRVEWAPLDVRGCDGTRVEVKTTGCAQSWRAPAAPSPKWSFASVTSATAWSPEAGVYEPVDPWDRLDVWVFALHTTRQGAPYDPTLLAAWEFRAIAHRELLRSRRTRANVDFFGERGIPPVGYAELREAVRAARDANQRAVRPADPHWDTPADGRA